MLTSEDELESHNYVLRVILIEDAWVEINATIDNLVFGKGYMRYGTAGDYDLVFGGDTYVAPVLYCEGILGLVMRVLPILILFIKYLKICFFIRKSEEKYKLYAVFGLSVILLALIGYLQTSLFVQYTLGVFVILSLEIIIFFDKKIKT